MNQYISEATVLPVGKYMSFLREHVEAYGRVWIEGELSEHTSRRGHWYFTIADESSSLKCVMWQSRARFVDFKPEPGQLLRVYGAPTVYPKLCRLQFDVRKIERRHTLGELQRRFLELKEKFALEGLFDDAKKSTLPSIPRSIGIVTSAEGAALQDILRILRDRFPICEVLVAPVRVQGPGAASEITKAIQQLNQLKPNHQPDLLIIGRGGGSLEDLWAFNQEPVVRAIARSAIPIISAVGHETDTTIADLVADVRAATPTHAAQTAVPDQMTLIQQILGYEHEMNQSVVDQTRLMSQRIRQLTKSYTFNSPLNQVRDAQQTLNNYMDQLHERCSSHLQKHRHQLELLEGRIKASDPRELLRRGYARVERNGRIIRSSHELNTNDYLYLHFSDGNREAVVCASD